MFRGQRIAVVVPAFNEADKIARTLRSVPGFVDHVLVIDDASGDGTGKRARRSQRRGLEVIRHPENQGVGAAIATGYAPGPRAGGRRHRGDGGRLADGSRRPGRAAGGGGRAARPTTPRATASCWPEGWRAMPLSRLCGNLLLSFVTRLASGYREVFDSQCGYTAANRRALATIVARAGVPPLRLPQRPAGPAGPRRSEGLRRAGAPGVRPRLALGHPHPQGGPAAGRACCRGPSPSGCCGRCCARRPAGHPPRCPPL